MGVLIKEDDGLGVFLAGLEEVLVGLELAHGVGVHVVVAATPADGEESAVFMRHLHQVGKERPARGGGHRAQVAGIAESPELLGVVPAEEVGVGLEEVFKGLQVGVLDMGMSAGGGLAGEPHVVQLADRGPRLIGAHGVARHAVHAGLGVKLAREAQVHADVGLDVGGNQVDDFLRVGRVPHVDVDEPQRMLRVYGSALLRYAGDE